MKPFYNLPAWPSGYCTQLPCAVERDTLSGRGLTRPRLRPPTKQLFLIIPTHTMNTEQGDNPGQEKRGSTVSSVNCDYCRHLDLAVSSLPSLPRQRESK